MTGTTNVAPAASLRDTPARRVAEVQADGKGPQPITQQLGDEN